MKKLVISVSLAMVALVGASQTTAFAEGPGCKKHDMAMSEACHAGVVPSVDSIEDGDRKLKLIGLPSTDGQSFQVTMVYEDAENQIARSVTVDPMLVASANATLLNSFLDEMDPGFLSFVKATLADRLLHLKAQPAPFDRAEAMVFFPKQIDTLAQLRIVEE